MGWFLLGNTALQAASGFWGFIYFVDENSVYTHASFYWIYVLSYVLSILYCVYIVARNVRKYQYSGTFPFVCMAILMLAGIITQMCNSSLRVDYITLSIASIMLYVFTLEMITQTDELTGLINRRGYENYLGSIEDTCVIIFFDVDKFKQVNDTYGHAFGDVVLSKVGEAIKNQYTKHGRCFRYGGDEFCVILNGEMNTVEAMNTEFYRMMEQRRKDEPRLPFVSIGYAYYDPKNQSVQEAAAEADRMMYKFKEAHREKENV